MHGDYFERRFRPLRRGRRVFILFRANQDHPLRWRQERLNRLWNSVRYRVKHVFGVLKAHFGWRRVRFRGLQKNPEYAYAALVCVPPLSASGSASGISGGKRNGSLFWLRHQAYAPRLPN